jgi:hypothetical protein
MSLVRSLVLITTVTSSPALAADIALACGAFDWSNPATWAGGAAPVSGDTGFKPSAGGCPGVFTLTIDPAAPAEVGAFVVGLDRPAGAGGGAFGVNWALGRDVTVAGDLALREGTLTDNGFDVHVDGILSNCGNRPCAYLNGEGNGLDVERTGGHVSADQVFLQRATQFSFRPGDTARQLTLACLPERGACPTTRVVQDPTYYAAELGEGLSLEGASATLITTGTSSAPFLILDWDFGLTGDIDWTLRVEGDRAVALRTAARQDRITVGNLPAGLLFDSYDNIWFNAADGFTYVGFEPAADSDTDGVPDIADFTLYKGPLIAGAPSSVAVLRAAPGATVRLFASVRGPGAGPCAPSGVCADILSPIQIGTATADSAGTATFTVTPPAAGRQVWLQAMHDGGGGDTTEVDAAITVP